jgi:hypothetical protein
MLNYQGGRRAAQRRTSMMQTLLNPIRPKKSIQTGNMTVVGSPTQAVLRVRIPTRISRPWMTRIKGRRRTVVGRRNTGWMWMMSAVMRRGNTRTMMMISPAYSQSLLPG